MKPPRHDAIRDKPRAEVHCHEHPHRPCEGSTGCSVKYQVALVAAAAVIRQCSAELHNCLNNPSGRDVDSHLLHRIPNIPADCLQPAGKGVVLRELQAMRVLGQGSITFLTHVVMNSQQQWFLIQCGAMRVWNIHPLPSKLLASDRVHGSRIHEEPRNSQSNRKIKVSMFLSSFPLYWQTTLYTFSTLQR